MKYATINPFNNETVKEFDFHHYPDISQSVTAFDLWSALSIAERSEQLKLVASQIEKRKAEFALLITLEMGKPIREAEYEINKTITAFDYYTQNAETFLTPQIIASNASKSYVRFDPLGVIFSIMPWNFPFWQVFRFAVPSLMAGNVTILKHAPSVPQCALAIEKLFKDADIIPNVFCNYFLNNSDAARLIADPRITGLSFTGSDTTGSYLAGLAGTHIKKCVMELGGNDAFIVLEDANVNEAVAGAIKSRSINSGQSCNGGKRFIVHKSVADDFTQKLIAQVRQLVVGNPLLPETSVGPLARKDLALKAKQQIADSIFQGAVAHYGQAAPIAEGNFITPVVLTNVTENTTAFNQEIFAPVWSIIEVESTEQAVRVANQSDYGLAASVWTKNQTLAENMACRLQTGNVFINDIVKSDARLPFGGIKRSGFGRELSEYGLKEFVNVKTVYIK